MIEQDRKQKEKKHEKTLQRMKKDIISDEIGNVIVSYSNLDKKGASGFTTNNRLFFLFHKDKVGYLNQLPKQTLLPFDTMESLPKKLKAEIKLDDISNVKPQKDAMRIEFKKGGKDQYWDFNGASKDIIKNWIRIVKQSIKDLKDDKLNPPQAIVVDGKQAQIKKQPSKSQDALAQNVTKEGEIKKNQETVSKKIQQAVKKPQDISSSQVKNQKAPQKVQKVGQSKPTQPAPLSDQKIQQTQNPYSENQNPVPVFGPIPQKKPEIQMPKKDFFVGGIAVSNQKDQVQLKNRMETIQTLKSKFKQEYHLKKQQSKKIEQQAKIQSMEFNPLAVGNNVLSISTNTKYQIERMQREWGYQFAKSQNEYQIVQKFKFYVQAVSRKIIDQLGLQEKKRYYQPQDVTNTELKYEINGVSFSVFLIELKQQGSSNNYGDKGTILSNGSEKMAAHEFKNYDYILRLTQNKGKIRVPLSMLTHYKGFAIMAKVLIPSAQAYQNMDLLEKQLQILEAQSRINNSIFQDPEPDNGRIVALQSKAYEKLARAQSSSKKFDLCYIEDLKYYLPHDFNNFNKQKPYERLRRQLIQDDDCEDKIFHGEDMCAISSRLKLPQNFRDGINELTEVGKIIPNRIDGLAQLLQSAEQYFTNSEQLSKIMHNSGINMRYLGNLLEKVKENWLKEIIMSQIIARCAKKYLNFDLQDCTLNLNETNTENVHKFQQKQLTKFLNKMLGNSQETQIFWKQLNRQSQAQFKVSINREQMNHSFLLQALQYHCCFKLKDINVEIGNGNDKKDSKSSGLMKTSSKIGMGNASSNVANKGVKYNIDLFVSSMPFSINNIAAFEHRSKVYNLQFTQFYSSIKTITSQQTPQSYEQLNLLLNLQRTQTLQSHFKLSPMYSQLILFLVNWVSPKQMHSVYYPEDEINLGQVLPSKLLYLTKLAEIRWLLKEGDVEGSEEIKKWVVEHVGKWIGECHPVLTELYEIYANYYMMHKDEEKKAVNYCKSAIRNQEKLIGQSHQKMADNYYLLGTVYRNYGKKLQAINSLKKSKQIILKNNNATSQAYGQVCLKMGQLYLAVNYPQDAVQSGLQAMEILEKCGNSESLAAAIQLVCRCYQVQEDWDSYMDLIENVLASKVVDFVQDVQLTERIIKLCILPSLKIIGQGSSNIAQKIIKLISQLPDTTRAPNMAYNFLRIRIQDKSFPQRFLTALNNIQSVLQEIQVNGMLARWKGFENLSNKSLLNKVGVNMENQGFNFIACLEALNIFIGPSFIEGVLLDS